MDQIKLKIGTNEITTDSQFTLILGKFKKNLLHQENLDGFIKILESLDYIPIDLFVNGLKSKNRDYSNLQISENVLKYISSHTEIVNSCVKDFSDYIKIIEAFDQVIRYLYLTKRRIDLVKELEISNTYYQSSELSAIKDLISKLNQSLEKNKKKLMYFEEDFQNIKNNINQLLSEIERLNKDIEEKTQFKKECFNQINKITRNLEQNQLQTDLETIKKLGLDLKLPNSEKIRMLQKKAQESQFEIKELNKILNNTESKYELIKPKYESYLKDYESLTEEIQNDESKLNELSKEIENNIKKDGFNKVTEKNQDFLKTPRPVSIIEVEYDSIVDQIQNFSFPIAFYNPNDPEDLNIISDKLGKVNAKIKNKINSYVSPIENDELTKSLIGLNQISMLLNSLEQLLNKLLSQINIIGQFQLVNDGIKNTFLIKSNFLRKNKEEINWSNLTTPEKIYFGIALFISIKLILEVNPIVFSNHFLPSIYNKRGSIFRSIEKILPLFEKEEKFKGINLVFVLSNLEMKKEIKNLKIIPIKES
ncbi:MAG: hypothetical protein ACFFKA_01375 [Candidatus Thorarchaeota archaeon]